METTRTYQCVCGSKEAIAKPYLGQIPAGWMQLSDDYLCNDCKMSVMLAAFAGAHKKVMDIRQRKKDYGW